MTDCTGCDGTGVIEVTDADGDETVGRCGLCGGSGHYDRAVEAAKRVLRCALGEDDQDLLRLIAEEVVDAARPIIVSERLTRDQAMRMILDLGSARVQATDAVAIREIVDLLIL